MWYDGSVRSFHHGVIAFAQPAQLRFGSASKLVAGLALEAPVGAAQCRPHAGRQRFAGSIGEVGAPVEIADESTERRIPWQDRERRRVGDGQDLLALVPGGDQAAVAADRQVGHCRTVELDAASEVPRQLIGRRDLGEHSPAEGQKLVVDVLDAGVSNTRGEFRLGGGVLFKLQPQRVVGVNHRVCLDHRSPAVHHERRADDHVRCG